MGRASFIHATYKPRNAVTTKEIEFRLMDRPIDRMVRGGFLCRTHISGTDDFGFVTSNCFLAQGRALDGFIPHSGRNTA